VQALVRLVQALKSDRNFAAIPNVAHRRPDGGFALTPTEPELGWSHRRPRQ
jgi:hypothetical protein